jgi:hypothetical protein
VKRSVRERVYLTPDEAAHLARLAEREGMSRSSYLGRVVRLSLAAVSTEHWPNKGGKDA